MRSRKELLAKRRELKKQLSESITTGNSKKSNFIRKFSSLLSVSQSASQIQILNWILDKPTAKQLKYEAMMKPKKKNGNRKQPK